MRYRIKDPDERQGLRLLGLPVEFKEEDITDRHTSYYFHGDTRDCIYLDFFSEFEIEPMEDSPTGFRFRDQHKEEGK